MESEVIRPLLPEFPILDRLMLKWADTTSKDELDLLKEESMSLLDFVSLTEKNPAAYMEALGARIQLVQALMNAKCLPVVDLESLDDARRFLFPSPHEFAKHLRFYSNRLLIRGVYLQALEPKEGRVDFDQSEVFRSTLLEVELYIREEVARVYDGALLI